MEGSESQTSSTEQPEKVPESPDQEMEISDSQTSSTEQSEKVPEPPDQEMESPDSQKTSTERPKNVRKHPEQDDTKIIKRFKSSDSQNSSPEQPESVSEQPESVSEQPESDPEQSESDPEQDGPSSSAGSVESSNPECLPCGLSFSDDAAYTAHKNSDEHVIVTLITGINVHISDEHSEFPHFYTCLICDYMTYNYEVFVEKHVKGKKHKAIMQFLSAISFWKKTIIVDKRCKTKPETFESIRSLRVPPMRYCQPCGIIIKNADLRGHKKWPMHKRSVENMRSCKVCNLSFVNGEYYEGHLGKDHSRLLHFRNVMLMSEDEEERIKQYIINHSPSAEIKSMTTHFKFFCLPCNLKFSTERSFQKHKDMAVHKRIIELRRRLTLQRSEEEMKCYAPDVWWQYCESCAKFFPIVPPKTYEDHLMSAYHKKSKDKDHALLSINRPKPKFYCLQCGLYFSNNDAYTAHNDSNEHEINVLFTGMSYVAPDDVPREFPPFCCCFLCGIKPLDFKSYESHLFTGDHMEVLKYLTTISFWKKKVIIGDQWDNNRHIYQDFAELTDYPPFYCPLCDMQFESAGFLRNHEKCIFHRRKSGSLIECTICNILFLKRENYEQHFKLDFHHSLNFFQSMMLLDEDEEETAKQNTLSETPSAEIESMRSHIRYFCVQCGLKFNNEESFQRHKGMAVHRRINELRSKIPLKLDRGFSYKLGIAESYLQYCETCCIFIRVDESMKYEDHLRSEEHRRQ